MILDKSHQIYIYYNPLKNNQEFYVGETGTDYRWLFHLKEAEKFIRQNRSNKWIEENADNPHKTRTIMKILRAGLEPKIEKVLEGVDEQTAKAEEIRLIALYGRADLGLGPLTNMTDGGDGQSGRIWTEERKESITGNNHWDYGKLWYTNMIDEAKFFLNEQPDNWITGRLNEASNKNKKCYNNGNEQRYFKEGNQPDNWFEGELDSTKENKKVAFSGENNGMFGKGHLLAGENNGMFGVLGKEHPHYRKKIYNNGINEERFFEGEQPDEFKKGRIFDQSGENNPIFGKKKYNNGKICKMFYPGKEPEEYTIGGLKNK